jgi:hypothetical protein
MEKRWMNQLMKALAIIPAVAMLHGVMISAVVFFGPTRDSMDKVTDPSLWGQAAAWLADVFMFPIRQVVEQRGYTAPHTEMLWWSNSLLWGIGVFLLIESRRMLKLKGP